MHSYNVDTQSLWAITSFYNPEGYWRRRHNYRLFRQHLPIPLLAIELTFDGAFELHGDDAEIVVRRSSGDVLWQKERLLNIALAHLPARCEQIVWVDCDVVFQRADWVTELRRQLEKSPFVQPFSRVVHLRADAALDSTDDSSSVLLTMPSLASLIGSGASASDCLGKEGEFQRRQRAPGIAWAARRELLAEHGFYDACITGGGDTALAAAAYGLTDTVVGFQGMNDWQARHYRAWAEPFSRHVRGEVGWLKGDVWHLWHGTRKERRVPQRYYDLAPFDFDPAVDIAHAAGACWHWSSDKPGLHECLRMYFAVRNEDGADQLQKVA